MNPRQALKLVLRHAAAGVGRLSHLAYGAKAPHDLSPRVLCYHGVCDDPPDEWSVTPAKLRAHMRLLRTEANPVSLGEIVAWVQGRGDLPPRAVAVTFDDGYLDVLTHAAPILADERVPGAAFVVPGLLTRGKGAADASFAVTRPLLDWAQLRELSEAGWTIGAHSMTHPVLSALPEPAARRELTQSRDELQQRLSMTVDLLAYPYGTPRTVSPRDQRLAAQAGYRAAFLDMIGPLYVGGDRLTLPRAKVLRTDSLFVVAASLRGQMDLWRLMEARA